MRRFAPIPAVLAGIALLLVGGPVRAQDREATGILVQGTGEARVRPDIARLTLGVQTQNADAAVAAGENAERTSKVIAAVRGAGVAERDIQTENYSITPQYDYGQPQPQNRAPRLVGYQVSNTVRVTARKIADVGKVIDAAVKAGANVAGGIAFDVDDPAPAKEAALKAAVADALRKARILADAARISNLTLVALVEGPISIPRPFLEVGAMREMAVGAAATPVQPGEQTVTAVVTARFNFIPGNPQQGGK